MTTLVPDIHLTNFSGAVVDDQHRPVPEWLRLRHAPESHEFAARELAREGYSAEAIGRALRIDVKLVRRITGAEL
jgi:hypothetical protein